MVTVTQGASKNIEKIKVSGTVSEDVSINDDENMFGDYANTNKGIIVTLDLPISGDGGVYTVKQTNPALRYFDDEGDPTVDIENGKYVKTKVYNIPAGGKFDYSLILESGTQATVELSQTGSVIKTYNIDASGLTVN